MSTTTVPLRNADNCTFGSIGQQFGCPRRQSDEIDIWGANDRYSYIAPDYIDLTRSPYGLEDRTRQIEAGKWGLDLPLVWNKEWNMFTEPVICDDVAMVPLSRASTRSDFSSGSSSAQSNGATAVPCAVSSTRSPLSESAGTGGKYLCTTWCGKSFARASDLKKHAANLGHPAYGCRRCPKQYTRPDSLARHVAKIHDRFRPGECQHCTDPNITKVYTRKDHWHQHLRDAHGCGPLLSGAHTRQQTLRHQTLLTIRTRRLRCLREQRR